MVSTAQRPTLVVPRPGGLPADDVLWLGRRTWQDAWDIQRTLHAERRGGHRGDALLLLEHAPVITLGRSGGAEFLRAAGPAITHPAVGTIELVHTDRGGKVTYHGPGQLVGYGIVDLAARGLFPGTYVHRLEQVLIDVLVACGLDARARPGCVGVWVEDRKIASIGVRVTGGVSLHGFALNVVNDLGPFELMDPCGLAGVTMTSVAREGVELSLYEARDRVTDAWHRHFPPVAEAPRPAPEAP